MGVARATRTNKVKAKVKWKVPILNSQLNYDPTEVTDAKEAHVA